MLRGEFFPDFECSSEPFSTYRAFSGCNPATNGDAALALLWGFVAGFAENFVPNALDKLAAETSAAAATPTDQPPREDPPSLPPASDEGADAV